MNILILESDPTEQKHISSMLSDINASIHYETSIGRAINSLGIQHTDLALVDADCKGRLCSWSDLVDFLKRCKIDYAVFSSNGKVGIRDGQKIVSINEIESVVSSKTVQHAS